MGGRVQASGRGRAGGKAGAAGWRVGVAMVTLILSVHVMIGLSWRIYRVGILMYGRQPARAEIVRGLRHT